MNKLSASETLNVDNTMSASVINDWLMCMPKNLGENTLTVQFADGTYTISSPISVVGFSNGSIYLDGNSTDNSLSTTKSVFLDATTGSDAIVVESCTALVGLRYFKSAITTGAANAYGLKADYSTYIDYNYGYVYGTATTYGAGILTRFNSTCYVRNTYMDNVKTAISAVSGAQIMSYNNGDTGTQPLYGLSASEAVIRKINATQPSGSTANELATSGGQILV
jgi:hypothetical protein